MKNEENKTPHHLITPEFEEIFKNYPIRSQDELGMDAIVVAKLFNFLGNQKWYLTEYCPEAKIAFGYVVGFSFDGQGEWGDIPMIELEEIVHPEMPTLPLIERDIGFQQKTMTETLRAEGVL